jgi:signal peptidase I
MKSVVFTVLGVAVLVAAGLALFAFEFPRVRTNDMAPGLRADDLVVACRICGQPQRGDVVVFAPGSDDPEEKLSFRRVVAVPGDKVEVRKGQVLVNDRPLDDEKQGNVELSLDQVTNAPARFEVALETLGKHRYRVIRDEKVTSSENLAPEVLKNDYFVLADRRTLTRDSRRYGPISRMKIRAKALRVISAGDHDASRQNWVD